jgi:hypothetical protein
MLTVTEGLARIQGGEAPVEMGALKTHPDPKDRVEAIVQQLRELKVPIERRRVTKSLVASAAEVAVGEQKIGEIRLNQRAVFQPAAALDGTSPVARAQQSADLLNSLLLSNLELLEISLTEQPDRAVIEARGQPIITITSADAEFHKTTVEALAQQAMDAIRLAFLQEKITRAY